MRYEIGYSLNVILGFCTYTTGMAMFNSADPIWLINFKTLNHYGFFSWYISISNFKNSSVLFIVTYCNKI